MENFCSTKDTAKRMERQVPDWEKFFATQISDRGLISKELLKLNNKKTDNLILKWAKDLKRHLIKENTKMANKHMKILNVSLGNCKIKQWDTSIHLLELPKIHSTWSNGNCHSLLIGVQNSTTILEDSLAIPFKSAIVQFSNDTAMYLFKRTENLCPHRNLHTDVYGSLSIIS